MLLSVLMSGPIPAQGLTQSNNSWTRFFAMSSIATCPSCGTKNRVPVVSAGRPQCASCHQPLPWLVNASDADLDAALNTSQLVLIDLWAPWCAPCRMVAPVLERLSVRYAGRIKVVKILCQPVHA